MVNKFDRIMCDAVYALFSYGDFSIKQCNTQSKRVRDREFETSDYYVYYKGDVYAPIVRFFQGFATAGAESDSKESLLEVAKECVCQYKFLIIVSSKDRVSVYSKTIDSFISFKEFEQDILINHNNRERVSFKPEVMAKCVHSPDTDLRARIFADINSYLSKQEFDLLYNGVTIQFIDDTEEDRFFEFMLTHDEKRIESFCRYTTLSTVFHSINNSNQRMWGLASMNDKSEVSYTDDYLSEATNPLPDSDEQDVNNCFILSGVYSSLSDNLTMWRLYGDDTKGVCLEYEKEESLLKDSSYYLAPISYGEEGGIHRKLELIKRMLTVGVNGYTFKLKRWSIWKHFFKPYDYKDEKEIRLLYISKVLPETWAIVDKNIISPYIDIPFKEFPLKLRTVILGPNLKERTVNVHQLIKFNEAKKEKISDLHCKESQIDNYRV